MANEEDRLVGDALDRVSAVLGVSRKQALAALITIAAVVGVSFYLALTSGISLIRQYETGGAPPTPEAAGQQSLLERAELPTLIEVGEPVPDAAPSEDGSRLRCGPGLSGQAGLRKGWVWDDSESSCRRVRQRECEGMRGVYQCKRFTEGKH